MPTPILGLCPCVNLFSERLEVAVVYCNYIYTQIARNQTKPPLHSVSWLTAGNALFMFELKIGR